MAEYVDSCVTCPSDIAFGKTDSFQPVAIGSSVCLARVLRSCSHPMGHECPLDVPSKAERPRPKPDVRRTYSGCMFSAISERPFSPFLGRPRDVLTGFIADVFNPDNPGTAKGRRLCRTRVRRFIACMFENIYLYGLIGLRFRTGLHFVV